MLRLYSLLLFFVSVSPIVLADETADWVTLYQRVDPELQTALEAELNKRPPWASLIRRGKLAVCVVDLSDDEPRFARINGNQMMYAASLPKIAILLAVYASFEDGSLVETEEAHQDLQDMIRVSSNSAATKLMDSVGMKKIELVLRDPQYGFYDEERGGGLWVGKRYAATGQRVGDPMHGISHGATATQVCRFYFLLNAGLLVSPQRSAQMLSDLSDPGLHHKFVGALDNVAPKASVYRKSGTWRNWHADSVLVRGQEWRDYILVALVESPNGEKILKELLPAVDNLLERWHPGARPVQSSP